MVDGGPVSDTPDTPVSCENSRVHPLHSHRSASTSVSHSPKRTEAMTVKSCLKQNTAPSTSSAPDPTSYEGLLLPSTFEQSQPMREARRKSVTFSDDGSDEEVKEEVFYVEVYDRSPMKVTNKLNYRCVACNVSRRDR